jgi:hypothetical protein
MSQSDPTPAAPPSTPATDATAENKEASHAESGSPVTSTVAELCATWASFGLGVAGDAIERFAAQQVRLGEALRKTSETLRKATLQRDAEADVPTPR